MGGLDGGDPGVVLKELQDRAARPVALRLRNVNPALITASSLSAAGGAGISILLGHFGYAALLLFACISLDALDGAVARVSGRSSRLGDLLDHVSDRYADMWVLSAIALSGEVRLWVSLLAITGVAITSYLGVQGQALGAGRVYTGPMARAFRYLYLTALSALRHAYGSARILDLGVLALGLMAHATAAQRFAILYRRLRNA